jgi:hypothetical protein
MTTTTAAPVAQDEDWSSHALSPRAFRRSSLEHASSLLSAAALPAAAAIAAAAAATPPTPTTPPLSIAATDDGGSSSIAAIQTYRSGTLPLESKLAERADVVALERHCTPERVTSMLRALALLPPPAPVPEHAHAAAASPRSAAAAAEAAAAALLLAAGGEDAAAAAARQREAEAEAIAADSPLNAKRRGEPWRSSGTALRVHELLKAGGEEGLTPGTLLRWLVARKGDGSKAARDLSAHAAWRAALVPLGRIVEDADLAPELAQRKVVLAAPPDEDEEESKAAAAAATIPAPPPPPLNPAHHRLTALTARGHALVVLYAGRHVSHHSRDQGPSAARVRRIIMYAIDAAVAASVASPCNPFKKIVGVFDLSDFGRKNFDVQGLRAIFEALNRHYPERCVYSGTTAQKRARYCPRNTTRQHPPPHHPRPLNHNNTNKTTTASPP